MLEGGVVVGQEIVGGMVSKPLWKDGRKPQRIDRDGRKDLGETYAQQW